MKKKSNLGYLVKLISGSKFTVKFGSVTRLPITATTQLTGLGERGFAVSGLFIPPLAIY